MRELFLERLEEFADRWCEIGLPHCLEEAGKLHCAASDVARCGPSVRSYEDALLAAEYLARSLYNGLEHLRLSCPSSPEKREA